MVEKRGRKKQDAAEVRRQLLDAAVELFARSGIEGVNTNQVARAAGVGVGTFYNHFADKRALYQAIVLDALEGLQAAIARTALRADEPIDQQVRELVISVIEFAAANPDRFLVAFGMNTGPRRSGLGGVGADDRDSRPHVGYSTRATERRLAALQQQGLVSASLDPAVAARAFVAMQNDVVCWWLEDPTRAAPAALVDTLVALHPAVAAGSRAEASRG